jgi:hypothetical protein
VGAPGYPQLVPIIGLDAGHPWLKAEPFTGEVTPEFLLGKESLFTTTGQANSTVCYSVSRRRGGFKSAPDMRPIRRRDIVRRIFGGIHVCSE